MKQLCFSLNIIKVIKSIDFKQNNNIHLSCGGIYYLVIMSSIIILNQPVFGSFFAKVGIFVDIIVNSYLIMVLILMCLVNPNDKYKNDIDLYKFLYQCIHFIAVLLAFIVLVDNKFEVYPLNFYLIVLWMIGIIFLNLYKLYRFYENK